ncbi:MULTISPECIES: hypothetical protein [unclassified Pedobacter]|uniref:hypothetical protein n=1 Tax=Pedobacter TaxID=84567 RepID=UPI0022476CB2|nr:MULTISPECIES: hypothetical protein [unclassified Pedobacter]MCX2432409.1 hypothetical protein [Pedobacter sp. GR22-10]MCX2583499.1 hypothetical protein [Pedobacter sp. MR22-3]
MSSRFKFFDDGNETVNSDITKENLVDNKPEAVEELSLKGNARYRVEQLTITKMDGVIQSHAETKREFFVTKSAGKTNLVVDVKMEENIVNIYPDSLQETINLLIELDVVKSTAMVAVNQTNGDIDRIINHSEIIEKWKKYRAELEKRFAGVQSPEAKLNVLKFLTVAENTIVIEKNLIDDLKTKMFYDLFFDEYLVNDRLNLEEHKRPFYSQLFEGQSSTLNFTKNIIAENESQVQYNNTGRLQKEDAKKFEQLYDLKYKPLVKYKFSGYDASIVETVLLDKKDKWILQADLSIAEEVKNNVELSVDYKLRKIE